MRFRQVLVSTMITAGTAAFGCGGGAQGGGAESPSGGGDFASWDRDKKMEFMASTVVPEMAKVFQAHSADDYAEFQCSTCHGEDFQAVDYKMPNSLYALPATDTIKQASDYDAEATKFMVDQVVPKMAELLGQSVDDPAQYCFSCHQKE